MKLDDRLNGFVKGTVEQTAKSHTIVSRATADDHQTSRSLNLTNASSSGLEADSFAGPSSS